MVQGSANSAGATATTSGSSSGTDAAGSSTYKWAPVVQAKGQARKEIDYVLKFRQQPRQARMCGVGDKADRRPIDPPPVVQLTVVDRSLLGTSTKANQQLSARDKAMAAASSRGGKSRDGASGVVNQPAGQTYLQNPYYLMSATLTRADDQQDLHLLKDGKTRYTLGSTVSSLFQLKDEDKSDAGFFVFPDLSVRVEGDFRLKLDLYEIVGDELHYCKTILSDPFQVYTAKRFPGNQQSTSITKLLSSQGIKVRTHHAAAPSRPASTRKLSTSSSKRKVDLAGQDPSSSAMVKSESSESSLDRHSVPERRGSEASSKRPRTAGHDSIGGGRPPSVTSYEASRPASYHSHREHDSRVPVTWGPPPTGQPYPSQYSGAAQSAGLSQAAPHHSYLASSDPRGAYRDPREAMSQDPSWARPDPRAEEAWRRNQGVVPMDGQLGPSGQPQRVQAVDLSRPTLPPLTSFRTGEVGQSPAEGQYYRPTSSSATGNGGPPYPGQFSDARNAALGRGSLGGSSEGSRDRSSMSSVVSERFSVSSERPSITSDPSSYGPTSVSSDASRMGPPYDLAGRYSSGLPSIQSLTTNEVSSRPPSQQPRSYPSDAFRPSLASGFKPSTGSSLPPSISSMPRLPSLSEMMSQPSMRISEPQRSLSPLERPMTGSSAQPPNGQTSPGRAPPSRSGRMGLSSLLASPTDD